MQNFWIGAVIVVAGLMLYIGVIVAFHYFWRRKGRYSPFTEEALRLPGHTLRQNHIDHAADLFSLYFAFTMLSLGVAVSIMLLSKPWNLVFSSVFVVVLLGAVSLIWKLLEKAKNFRLGLEGEEYVGQELNLLMCKGAHVFHDIPYKYGNIDHIVIGRSQVFAIETKAVSKHSSYNKNGELDSTVVFDGERLKFPHSTVGKPIQQARLHAKFLQKAIQNNCSVSVDVIPVVALPGWTIKSNNSASDVLVINPKRGKELGNLMNFEGDNTTRNEIAIYLEKVARSVPQRSKINDPTASDKYDFWLNDKEKSEEVKIQ